MSCQLLWKASLSATCLHAARCQHAGVAAVEPALAEAVRLPAEQLYHAIGATGWPAAELLTGLLDLSAGIENNEQLVERAATRIVGPGGHQQSNVRRVAGAITDLESAMLQVQADVVDQLAVRGGPLREQWEARGPGLLRQIGKLTDPLVEPATAEIVFVAPYAGGHGVAHPKTNRIVLEAVLVNPTPDLPEVLRLGWLLSQLNLDLPLMAEALQGPARNRLGALAMIPPTLAASETVELGRLDQGMIQTALGVWRLDDEQPSVTAGALWNWWETYRHTGAAWPVALASLEQLLAG